MSDFQGTTATSGAITMRKRQNVGDLSRIQSPGMLWKLKNYLTTNFMVGKAQTIAADTCGSLFGIFTLKSKLSGYHFRPDYANLAPEQILKLKALLADNVPVTELASPFRGVVTDYGTMSYRVVTTAGVVFLANNFAAGGQAISNFKFHGFGTGTTAEAVGDVALVTELTTQYAVDNTRPTGSQASTSNVYTTIGTLSPDSGGTIAITEHGIFSASSSTTLWDRSVFSAVNLVAGSDSLQVTYALTCTAGG